MASADGQNKSGIQLPRAVRVFWAVSLVAFGLTLLISWLEFRAGFPVTRWNPLSDHPLLGDFMEYPGTYQLLHTSSFFTRHVWPDGLPMFFRVAYPPFATAVMAPMYLAPNPIAVYFMVTGLALLAGCGMVIRALLRAGIRPVAAVLFPISVMLISFPIQRLIHQGNCEILLAFFAAAGLWAFLEGHDDAAAVLWGLAAAMKLYPILFLILFLPRRRYRAFAEGVGAFVLSSFLSLLWLGPTLSIAWKGSLANVFGYQAERGAEWSLRELVANHSVITVVKLIAAIVHFPLSKITLPYYALGAVVMAWAFFGRLWKMPVTNQVLAVCLFMAAFPPISYYHALINLYAPLVMLVFLAIRAQKGGVAIPGLQATMVLFVPLFVPYTLLTFPHVFLYCGLLQSLVLLVLFARSLEYPLQAPEKTVQENVAA